MTPAMGDAELEPLIQEMASKYKVDPALVRSIIRTESSNNPRARSPKGAVGLMQLMPATAADMGVTDLYDPRQNVEGGTKYFASLVSRYSGDTAKALAAYNAGPGRVARGGPLPQETQNYVPKVQGGAGAQPTPTANATSGASTSDVNPEDLKFEQNLQQQQPPAAPVPPSAVGSPTNAGAVQPGDLAFEQNLQQGQGQGQGQGNRKPPNPDTILADPDFATLPISQRRALFASLYGADYTGASEADQIKAVMTTGHMGSSTPGAVQDQSQGKPPAQPDSGGWSGKSYSDAAKGFLTGAAKGATETAMGLGEMTRSIPGVGAITDALGNALADKVVGGNALPPSAGTLAERIRGASSAAGADTSTPTEAIGKGTEHMAEFFTPTGAGGLSLKGMSLLQALRAAAPTAFAEAVKAGGISTAQGADPTVALVSAILAGGGAEASAAMNVLRNKGALAMAEGFLGPRAKGIRPGSNPAQSFLDEGIIAGTRKGAAAKVKAAAERVSGTGQGTPSEINDLISNSPLAGSKAVPNEVPGSLTTSQGSILSKKTWLPGNKNRAYENIQKIKDAVQGVSSAPVAPGQQMAQGLANAQARLASANLTPQAAQELSQELVRQAPGASRTVNAARKLAGTSQRNTLESLIPGLEAKNLQGHGLIQAEKGLSSSDQAALSKYVLHRLIFSGGVGAAGAVTGAISGAPSGHSARNAALGSLATLALANPAGETILMQLLKTDPQLSLALSRLLAGGTTQGANSAEGP